MVQLASNPVAFQRGQTTQIQQSSLGQARPDVNAHPIDDSLERLLGTVAKVGEGLAEKKIDTDREQAYLDGAAAVGTVENEEALETSPFTADWTKAGFRDTAGRLLLADSAAQFQADLPKLRTQTPEEVKQYLSDRRAAVLPKLEGMSAEARKTAFLTLAQNDRVALKTHNVEYQKYIVEQQTLSLQTAASVHVRNMTAAQGDASRYAATVDAAFTFAYTDIMGNQRLTSEKKLELLQEYAQFALTSDNQQLYERLRSEVLPGSKNTMLDGLPMDKQAQLAGNFRESMGRTQAVRLADYQNRLALHRSLYNDPTKPLPSLMEHQAIMQEGIRNGSITASEIESKDYEYYTAVGKRSKSSGVVQAYLQGNVQGLFNLGATPEEGRKAAIEAWQARGAPLPEVVGSLVTLGGSRGDGGAYQEAGKLLAPAIKQIGLQATMDPTNVEMLRSTFTALDAAEAQGHTGAFAQFMLGLDDESRDKLTYMREALKSNPNVEEAAKAAATRMAEMAKITPEARAAIAANSNTENAKIVQSIDERQAIGSIFGWAKGIFSTDAGNLQTISPYRGYFDNEVATQLTLGKVRLAMSEELGYVTNRNPLASADARTSAALAAVAARTIKTEKAGPLVMPRGVDMHKYFGVPTSVGPERIGQALDKLGEAYVKDGEHLRYEAQADGTFMFRRYNKDGMDLPGGTVSPSAVGAMVDYLRTQDASRNKSLVTMGLSKRLGNGPIVHYDGQNTAGVDLELMAKYRENLIQNEGITDKLYKDGTTMTGGVGVSARSKFFPPEWRKEGAVLGAQEINASLAGASNEAAAAGVQYQRSTGLGNDNWFLMFSELAYQSGPAFLTTSKAGYEPYRRMVQAAQQGNKEAAVSAFRESPAFRMSGEHRQQHYLKLLNKAMER